MNKSLPISLSKLLVLFLIFLLINPTLVYSSTFPKQSVINIVNPVRSRNLWNDSTLQPLQAQYQAIQTRNLNATWLIQYDALFDQELVNLINTFADSHEIGLFLEVSQKLASDASVPYKIAIGDWAWPDKVYLSGYKTSHRQKMIDIAVTKFNQVFNQLPKSAGAWHVDPFSLVYLKNKYNLNSTIGVADQFDTDANRQWGQFWGVPYYPSKYNPLQPAQSLAQKLDVPKIQWALRDPLYGYGSGPFFSNYSLQANDYTSEHNLDENYFKKILLTYLEASSSLTQATVGLEVGQEGHKYKNEFSKQLDIIKQLKSRGVNIFTMNQFADTYKNYYPNLSPPTVVIGKDNLNATDSQAIWFMSPKVRARFVIAADEIFLEDFRHYPALFPSIDLWHPQKSHRIIRYLPSQIDNISFGNKQKLNRDQDFLNNLSEQQVVDLIPMPNSSSLNQTSIILGNIYETLKEISYTNLSRFIYSHLNNTHYLGIKIDNTTFFGISWPLSLGIKQLPPQTLAHFLNLGSIINLAPNWFTGPSKELKNFSSANTNLTIIDHDQAGAPEFRKWQEANPSKKRLFTNSLAEIWQQ